MDFHAYSFDLLQFPKVFFCISICVLCVCGCVWVWVCVGGFSMLFHVSYSYLRFPYGFPYVSHGSLDQFSIEFKETS